MSAAHDHSLHVLVVCTANICRSVMTQAALRAEIERRGLPVEVSSSGFLYNGEPASDAASRVLAERGLDVSAHRSRISTPKIVERADLVVTMERRHGRDITVMVNRPNGVFTLVTAVELLGAVDPSITAPLERIAAADTARLGGDLLSTGPDEIDDPFGKSLKVNRKTAEHLADLAAALLDGLYPASAATPS